MIKNDFVSYNRNLIKAINAAVEAYLDGDPVQSFDEIDRVFNVKGIPELIDISEIEPNTTFYRMRIGNENFTQEDMFHIPFDKRGKVRSQRYSIPGFPSLYLSDSIYLCWEKLGRPNIDNFHVVKIVSSERIRMLSFNTTQFYVQNYTDTDEGKKKLLSYIMTWPLILACSTKVKNRVDFFKPEYIVPQLLLQWVRKNNEVEGIKYFSTNIDYTNLGNQGNFYNFVLPVKENKDVGFCKKLVTKFVLSQPLSNIQTYQWTNVNYPNTQDDINHVNNVIKSISLVKGIPAPAYCYSIFAKFEYFLNGMKTNLIKES